MFLFLKYISRVELLGHMANPCLTFWGTDKLFSTATVPFYISTSSAGGVQFFYIHNTCYYIFLIIASYWAWSGIVVLICIFLMANDVQHFFKCLLPFVIFFFEKGLVRSFVHKHRWRACCEPSAVLSLWYLAPALGEAVVLPDRLAHTGFNCMHAPLMQR